MHEMISGVFFHRLPSAADFADTVDIQVSLQEFVPALGHGVRVQAEEVGHPLIPTVTEFERFQAGVEATLPFIQQAGEENNGCF